MFHFISLCGSFWCSRCRLLARFNSVHTNTHINQVNLVEPANRVSLWMAEANFVDFISRTGFSVSIQLFFVLHQLQHQPFKSYITQTNGNLHDRPANSFCVRLGNWIRRLEAWWRKTEETRLGANSLPLFFNICWTTYWSTNDDCNPMRMWMCSINIFPKWNWYAKQKPNTQHEKRRSFNWLEVSKWLCELCVARGTAEMAIEFDVVQGNGR